MPKLRYKTYMDLSVVAQITFQYKNNVIFIFQVSEVLLVEDESPVKYSVETVFVTDNYEVV